MKAHVLGFFARMVSYIRRRAWRNSSSASWSDAIFVTELVVSLPLAFLLIGVAIAGCAVSHMTMDGDHFRVISVIALLVTWAVLDFWLTRTVSGIDRVQISGETYSSRADAWFVNGTMVVSVLCFVVEIVISGFVGRGVIVGN
jgi:hypothetical protein